LRRAGDDLEQVASLECLARHPDQLGVLAGRVVAGSGDAGSADVRRCRGGPRQSRRRHTVHLELVAPAAGDLAPVVHDDQLVREIENEIALGGRALEPEADGLELKRQIVPECAVEPEVRLAGMVEEIDQGTQHREHRGLPAALLLREAVGRCPHSSLLGVTVARGRLDDIETVEDPGDHRQEQPPPRIERFHAEATPPSRERQRWVHEPEVPPGVAPGVLVTRGEQRARTRIERGDDRLDGVLQRDRVDGAVDGQPAASDVALGLHGRLPFPGTGPYAAATHKSRPARSGSGRLARSGVYARRAGAALRRAATTTTRLRARAGSSRAGC
jgi:hypothetical protein